MTDTFCGSADCGHPVKGTTLCADCYAILTRTIAEIPWLIDELRNTITRQTRYGRSGTTSRTGERPLLHNEKASDSLTNLTDTICRWQERMANQYGEPVRYPNPVTGSAWMITAITVRPETLNTWTDAGKMLDALNAATKAATNTIDRPPDRWYAGVCNIDNNAKICTQELYVVAPDGYFECPRCGWRHDVSHRRETLLHAAYDRLASATEAARAITVWSDYGRGEARLVNRINTWVTRGRIQAKSSTLVNGRPRPLYRIGDILDLLSEDAKGKTA